MNLAVNHEDARRHLVEFCFERKFDKSNLLSLLLPFVNDPISTRSGAFGQVKELDVHKLETSDFDLTPGQAIAKFNSEEESKDYSFFIDGESFIPARVQIQTLSSTVFVPKRLSYQKQISYQKRFWYEGR
jgi:hypothetical protein